MTTELANSRDAFSQANQFKTNFDGVYSSPDPRRYFSVLYGLNYVLPDLASAVVRQVIRQLLAVRRSPVKVVDLGCSYGINAALARFPLGLGQLARRYADPAVQTLDSGDLAGYDRHYFASWPQMLDAEFVGVDISRPAIDYAKAVGLLHDGIAADFESREPTAAERATLAGADLIVSTGCVGYVTERTFSRLLGAIGPRVKPWLATFVLRMFPFDAIEQTLARHGLLTEKLSNVAFVQRRFGDAEEFRATVDRVRARGLDTQGKEEDGFLLAELYLSRPIEEAERLPIGDLFSLIRGDDRIYGRRFHYGDDSEIRLLPF